MIEGDAGGALLTPTPAWTANQSVRTALYNGEGTPGAHVRLVSISDR